MPAPHERWTRRWEMMSDLDHLRTLGHSALRRVARGQIVAENGVLRHHSDVLPPDVITTLQEIHHDGLITLTLAHPDHSAWPVAELTVSGIQLLDRWNKQPPLVVAVAPANGDTFVDPIVEVVAHDQSS
jgi:hypothetical protein